MIYVIPIRESNTPKTHQQTTKSSKDLATSLTAKQLLLSLEPFPPVFGDLNIIPHPMQKRTKVSELELWSNQFVEFGQQSLPIKIFPLEIVQNVCL